MKELLCRAACEWAGVPVQEEEMKWLTKDLAAMFESAAAVGPKHWRGRIGRNRVEQWVEKHIAKVREGKKIQRKYGIIQNCAAP